MEGDRFVIATRANLGIQEGESLDIFCESSDGVQNDSKGAIHLLCTDFHTVDNSFVLRSADGQALKPDAIQGDASFWTSRCILPSDGMVLVQQAQCLKC
jgi:hypothetical protein